MSTEDCNQGWAGSGVLRHSVEDFKGGQDHIQASPGRQPIPRWIIPPTHKVKRVSTEGWAGFTKEARGAGGNQTPDLPDPTHPWNGNRLISERQVMLFESIICRKSLDEARGNPWICDCPLCKNLRARSEGNESGEIIGESGEIISQKINRESEARPGEQTE